VILHAPLAFLGALFAVTVAVQAPQGGMSGPPLGVAERAAVGDTAGPSTQALSRQVALAD
jgi:hypothetical protein